MRRSCVSSLSWDLPVPAPKPSGDRWSYLCNLVNALCLADTLALHRHSPPAVPRSSLRTEELQIEAHELCDLKHGCRSLRADGWLHSNWGGERSRYRRRQPTLAEADSEAQRNFSITRAVKHPNQEQRLAEMLMHEHIQPFASYFDYTARPRIWSNAMIRIDFLIRLSGLIDRVRRFEPTRLPTLVEADRLSQECSPVSSMGGVASPGAEASTARAASSVCLWIA